jgi:hypothetical protein
MTPEKRKRLVLAAERVYQKDVELSGVIEEVDWAASTFRLRTPDGTWNIPMDDSFHPKARDCGGRERRQITVRGLGAYDSWDKLKKVLWVDSLEVQLNYQIASKLDELASLQDGWYEGAGLGLDAGALAAITEHLVAHYPEDLPLPRIFPTPEGNLLLEWQGDGDPSLEVFLGERYVEFHMFQPDDSELEQRLPLRDPADWQEVAALLKQSLAGL